MRTDDDLGATAEWYLTVRCANPLCRRLIAFQKSVDQGDNLDLAIAITGNLSALQGRDSFPSRSHRAASGCAEGRPSSALLAPGSRTGQHRTGNSSDGDADKMRRAERSLSCEY
jgi:hypothetical protein